MADISTSVLEVGNNRLILQDAEARTKINDMYITDTASGAIASFPDGAAMPVKSLKVNIEPVQSGSGDPSPDNVRPISGHTQAVVTRCGKNLATKTIHGYVRVSDKKVLVDNDSESVVFYAESGKTYTVSSSATMGRSILGLASTDEITSGFQLDNAIELSGSVNTWTATWTGWTVWYKCSNAQSAFANSVQVELGTTSTAYEPYNGQTVTIDLNGTRYGGTLDVGTGVLTVDRVAYTFTNGTGLTEGTDGNADWLCVKHQISSDLWDTNKRTQNICSHAPFTFANVNGHPHFYTTRNIFQLFVPKSVYASLSAFTSSLATNPLTFVAMLSTPTTVQLTANEISTVLGQNNIWNDCGDTEVEYRADTKLYIEKLTAPTEDDMVADHAISANSFFMVGNTLYRATTAIASGATITVGTNATKLSLSDALNALA